MTEIGRKPTTHMKFRRKTPPSVSQKKNLKQKPYTADNHFYAQFSAAFWMCRQLSHSQKTTDWHFFSFSLSYAVLNFLPTIVFLFFLLLFGFLSSSSGVLTMEVM